jgi:hypothetical protein
MSRQPRSIVAVCLTLLFSFFVAAPVFSATFSAAETDCCKKQCCCRRHKSLGPELSAQTCGTDCSHLALGNIAMADAPDPIPYAMPEGIGSLTTIADSTHSRRTPSDLQQRPPPFPQENYRLSRLIENTSAPDLRQPDAAPVST